MTERIRKLTSAVGVAGDERLAAQVACELLEPYGSVTVDRLGSVICTVKEPKQGGEHLLLDAHIDQIGMIVQGIDDKGFLKVARCGGIDRRLLLANEVTVHGKKDIYGVICSKPPHLSKADDRKKTPEIEDIAIDIGYSKEQAEQLVSLGDRVTIKGELCEMVNGQIVSQALDDRVCCAAILECLELLKGKQYDCGLTVMFTTREEVGGQGARAAAFAVEPTKAIAVDVSFGYTPDSPKHKCGELSKGGMIGFAPTISHAFSQALVETAKANNIPYQIEVMGGTTGTNADEIVTSREGVTMGMVSIPLKYMHTPIEMIDPSDVYAAARLMAQYIIEKGGEAQC